MTILTRSIRVNIFSLFTFQSSIHFLFSGYLEVFILTYLPEDARVYDVDGMINLDTQKLQTEAMGEKIIKEIQEWLLTRVGSQETAVLPEDKIQRLLVGVSNSLVVSLKFILL